MPFKVLHTPEGNINLQFHAFLMKGFKNYHISCKEKIAVIYNILRKIYHTILKCKIHISLIFSRNKICSAEQDPSILENTWKNVHVSCVAEDLLQPVSDRDVDLSIVIPLYNSVDFIDKCLQSLVHQTTDYIYEIVLINDGSTDHTEEKAKSWVQKYPVLIKLYSQSNSGISAARNLGIQKSCGKYIGFIDHDDFVDSSYIQELLQKAENSHADIVKCGYAYISNNEIIESCCKEDQVLSGGMKNEIFSYASYIWAGIYSRDLFQKVCFPDHYWYEDMIARFLLYRQSQKFVNINKVLYYKVSHDSNAAEVIWSAGNPKCLEQLYLAESLIEDNAKLGLPEDAYFYQNIVLEFSTIMYARIKHMDKKVIQQVFLRCSEILNTLYKESYEKDMLPRYVLRSNIIRRKRFNEWKLTAQYDDL